ncbi:MAG: ABC transporter substrate-binding protein [Abditibacteriales bacterium]|nr:ABC transporter substrate-binding protein [Abditibacteriales bacterium]MDW8367410.1 ABC transporter substrate-binding protein [Abditibacteriales bacterium]
MKSRWTLGGLMVLGGAILLIGCSKPSSEEPSPDTTTTVRESTRPEIAVVPKGVTHDFWLTVRAGAEKAGAEEKVTIRWNGPQEETRVKEQIDLIEDFINKGVSAIVMAACDKDALVPTVRKARAKGIPVVTIDSGINAPDLEEDVPLIATDNIEGARKAARTLAELIHHRGKVGLIPFIKGAATSDQREKGFVEELKNYPHIKLVSTLYSNSNIEEAMKKTEDMLTAHPDLDGIFACNEPGVIGAARVLEQRGLAGKVKLVGFDASQDEITALQKGTVQALIVQNPFKMGYEGVKAAVLLMAKEELPQPRIDTGVAVVTRENLNEPNVVKLVDPLGKLGLGKQ